MNMNCLLNIRISFKRELHDFCMSVIKKHREMIIDARLEIEKYVIMRKKLTWGNYDSDHSLALIRVLEVDLEISLWKCKDFIALCQVLFSQVLPLLLSKLIPCHQKCFLNFLWPSFLRFQMWIKKKKKKLFIRLPWR